LVGGEGRTGQWVPTPQATEGEILEIENDLRNHEFLTEGKKSELNGLLTALHNKETALHNKESALRYKETALHNKESALRSDVTALRDKEVELLNRRKQKTYQEGIEMQEQETARVT
jgi:peptidoglycan hydrolase CwlO-like protein